MEGKLIVLVTDIMYIIIKQERFEMWGKVGLSYVIGIDVSACYNLGNVIIVIIYLLLLFL